MECPDCGKEMDEETAVQDGWDYGTDSHTTTESIVYVCPDKECGKEIDDSETEPEPFNVDGDE